MKAFASALLLAGAHAAAGAIEFAVEASSKIVSLSSPHAVLKVYGPKGSGIEILNDN